MEISAITNADIIQPKTGIDIGQKSDFQVWLEKSLDTVNTKLVEADNKIQAYAIGDSDNIHDVMLSVQSAKLNFQLLVEVRNKVLEGYQELSRMQI